MYSNRRTTRPTESNLLKVGVYNMANSSSVGCILSEVAGYK